MRTYKIYLIRHGITQANLEGRYVGSTDVPLCEGGIVEIAELVKDYEYPKVSTVYTSPLMRCIQTAKIIYPNKTAMIVDDLSELCFGEWENKTTGELENDVRFKQFVKSNLFVDVSGAEEFTDFQQRISNGLDLVIKDMMNKGISDAAVVTHGGVIMQLLAHCGLPKRSVLQWSVGNGKGYALLVNASLWGNNKTVEVCNPIPFGCEDVSFAKGYSVEKA